MALFDTYIKQHRVPFTADLARFCRQPSIASTGEGMEAMAEMVADRLRMLGAVTRMHCVDGSYPYIVGELGQGPRTLLLYNHYDVQPARREDGWTYNPFDAVLEDGRIYARGVADNKANLLFRIHALEAYLATRPDLPVRVRFLVEGEEEIGSPNLPAFVARHPELVRADGCIWESGRKSVQNRPLLQLGVRGILYLELSLQSPSREVHSSWGNIVQNPALPVLDRLRQAVDSLTDEAGRPTFGDVLDYVLPPTDTDLAMLAAIPFDLDGAAEALGVSLRPDLDSRIALRRLFFEPTCTVCGMGVGYTGPGTKTVIPHRTVVKLDFRLPPGLTPDLVEALLRAHLAQHGFADIEVRRLGGLRPSRTAPDAAIVQVTRAAIQHVYGMEPIIHPWMTASGPMYELCESQGVPAVTFGTGHPSDNVHGTDENIIMEDYFQAIRAFGEIVRRFGEQPPL